MSRTMSFFMKCFAALGFSTILGLLYMMSRVYLHYANLQLVNPFIKGLSDVTGYYETIIIGTPLIGGFLVGVVAVWFYNEEDNQREKMSELEKENFELKSNNLLVAHEAAALAGVNILLQEELEVRRRHKC